MNTITLNIDGMACGHCEIAVQDAIRKLPGIKKAKAELRKKKAVVEFDSALVSEEQIVQAVNETGYTVI